jgi:Thioester domain/PEP-CTERM motif
MRLTRLATAALLGASLIPSTVAANTVINITGYSFSPSSPLIGKVTHTGLPGEPIGNVYIGRLKMVGTDTTTMTPVEYLTYCVNIFKGLHTGQFTTAPLSTLTTLAQRQKLNRLLTNATPNNVTASAAIQLAVWEIMYETSGPLDVNSGVFFATNGNSASARTLANTYLGNLGGWNQTSAGSVKLLYAADNQSQIYLGVPEPETWALMLLGFGAVGLAARRRRAKSGLSITS